MKLGIIVGHTRNSKGAFSPWLQKSEYDWNSDLAELLLQTSSRLDRRVFFRDGVGISGAYSASDAWGSKITVELHFNSSHNEAATGSAALYYPGSARGRQLAMFMVEEMQKALGLPVWPRGTTGAVTPWQASGAQQRGMGSLSAGRAPANLLEPFFGSNKGDSEAAESNKQAYTDGIIAAAERLLFTS